MFSEDDLLPISALQHFVFCERQAALIHIERVWRDNARTVEGTHLHDVVNSGEGETRSDLRITRSLPLRSFMLGLSGQADVVEFHRGPVLEGVTLEGRSGSWRPVPVEYKRGVPKKNACDRVQLCAQALCLEEMLGVNIAEGLLFYGKTKRRVLVPFDTKLRWMTEDAARRFRALVEAGVTPRAVHTPKCRECSLLERCRPAAAEKSAVRYLSAMLAHAARSSAIQP